MRGYGHEPFYVQHQPEFAATHQLMAVTMDQVIERIRWSAAYGTRVS